MLPATYNPGDPASERQEVAVSALFLMMGRGLERLPVSCAVCRYLQRRLCSTVPDAALFHPT